MTQDESWLAQWQEVVDFMKTNHRRPSKFVDEERGKFLNWLKHNQKLYAGLLKEERVGIVYGTGGRVPVSQKN